MQWPAEREFLNQLQVQIALKSFLIKLLDSHKFYCVIPNVYEESYKISAFSQISPFGRDDISQSKI